MDAIFHEKQEGSLCAQHCLNALLQGSYFTAVDLASLGQKLDDEERIRMAESGFDSEDYRRFLEQPSGNYDDSGYFSVQVISSALEVWGLELVPYGNTDPRAVKAQKCPASMDAFICNYRDHWFTIRRLGRQWFNLNSLLTQPELVSDTYLGMFLAQLQQEGYSIFVVFGTFPECEADHLLLLAPAVQTSKPRLISTASNRLASDSEDDAELQRALRLSLGQVSDELDDDAISDKGSIEADELKRVLRISHSSGSQDDDMDLQKALCLSLQSKKPQEETSDDQELQEALRMSLECCEPPSTEVNAAEVRRKRLNYLDTRVMLAGDLPSTSNEKVNS